MSDDYYVNREVTRFRESVASKLKITDCKKISQPIVQKLVKLINYLNSDDTTKLYEQTKFDENLNELNILLDGQVFHINVETLDNRVWNTYEDHSRTNELSVSRLEIIYKHYVKTFNRTVEERIIKELVQKRFNDVVG